MAEALESFDPESWCSPSKLLGLANFVDGDGTHADRVFTPVGKGNEALQSSLCAARQLAASYFPLWFFPFGRNCLAVWQSRAASK